MMANKFTVYLCALGFIAMLGCGSPKDDELKRPIVTVDGSTLTFGDLKNAIPENLSYSDSIALADDFIGRWVRSKLMLRQAELNLSPAEKNVERLLDEYRTSLLVHLYQQKMLDQKHSPLVTSREIAQYYNEMQDNFNLQDNIIKGVFIKVPVNAPNQDQLRRWYRSLKQEDIINLEAYSFQYARKYEQFIETWVSFNRINALLPEPIRNQESFLRWTRNHEARDSLYNYYFSVHDYKLAGSTAPLNYVEDRIKAILLNKKRMEFIQRLGQDLYEEALRDKIVNFH
ncbi:hypothetical protein [Alkaliflexus imshenetskii]|uniref:hypothetical protein n=1 Tax=Alkaliflexus imshenetskii TaxID=286730 RepID=UPI00047EDD2D|nr:hypothetical protein [Alkaliflexus imshenetskii]